MILGGQLPGKVGRRRFFWPHGQAVKTSPFHGGNPGSIPGGVTNFLKILPLGNASLAPNQDMEANMRAWRNWQTH
jgi:hypothetical protein